MVQTTKPVGFYEFYQIPRHEPEPGPPEGKREKEDKNRNELLAHYNKKLVKQHIELARTKHAMKLCPAENYKKKAVLAKHLTSIYNECDLIAQKIESLNKEQD